MFKQLLKRQIVEDILSHRFLVHFVLILMTVIIFSLLFSSHFQIQQARFSKKAAENDRNLRQSSAELVRLLATRQEFPMEPWPSRFIADGYEEKIPQSLSFVPQGYSFLIRETSSSPVEGSTSLSSPYPTDLTFIVQFLLSFFAVVLTFNAITVEKEKRTLSQVFANPVKRSSFVMAKYTSAFLTVILPFLLSLIIGLILLSLSPAVPVYSMLLVSLLMFFFVSCLYISIFILLGLALSASTHSSKNSLVLCLLAWIFLVVILPKSSGLLLNLKPFDIPTEQKIEELSDTTYREVWNRYSGLDLMTRSGEDESTRLNARVGSEAQQARQEVLDNFLRKKLSAVETLRRMNFISPASLFEYSASAISGTGIFHFQNLWKQVKNYQNFYLEFFRQEDSKDPKSFHIYFHPDYLSRNPVDFNTIPKFDEQEAGAVERVMDATEYVVLLILFNLMLFILVFYKFQRYDVR